jgi:type I restriction enzyme, S subunit
MTLPAGYKQTEIGVIPEDWEVEPLENFTSFISYGFTNPMPTSEDGVYMVTARDINGGKILLDSARCTTHEAFNKFLTPKSKPKKNDILLTKDGTLGRLAIVDDSLICINQSVAILRPNTKIDPLFFKLLLESPYYQSKMIEDAGGSTIKHIYITIVNKMLLGIPPTKTEQQLIATALSDTDLLIESLEKLIAKKRQIKQGAMQELLSPKEGWEVKKLGEIALIATGNTPPTSDRSNYGDEYLFVSPADLGSTKWIIDSEKKLSQKGFNISRKFPKNSILFTCIGSTIGKTGMANRELTSNQQINAVFPSETFSSSFLYYQLNYLSPKIKSLAGEQAVPLINKTQFSETNIPLPSTLIEQENIATILSDMDAEITALEERLEKPAPSNRG